MKSLLKSFFYGALIGGCIFLIAAVPESHLLIFVGGFAGAAAVFFRSKK